MVTVVPQGMVCIAKDIRLLLKFSYLVNVVTCHVYSNTQSNGQRNLGPFTGLPNC